MTTSPWTTSDLSQALKKSTGILPSPLLRRPKVASSSSMSNNRPLRMKTVSSWPSRLSAQVRRPSVDCGGRV